MQFMIDALKEVEPQEVAGHILANPKIQMGIGAVLTGSGSAAANAELAFRNDVMFYLGAATAVAGLLVAITIITRNLIGISKDLKK